MHHSSTNDAGVGVDGSIEFGQVQQTHESLTGGGVCIRHTATQEIAWHPFTGESIEVKEPGE
jgi:hypothetical protein